MKIKKKYIVLFFLLLTTVLSLTACGVLKPKEAVTLNQFTAKAKSMGYQVIESDGVQLPDSVTNAVMFYIDEPSNTTVEFYQMRTANQAIGVYENIVSQLEAKSSSNTKVNGTNFRSGTWKNYATYSKAITVDTIFILGDGDIKHKDAIDKFFKELGY